VDSSPLPERPHDALLAAWALHRFGGSYAARPGLRRVLGRTDAQLDALLWRAAESGFVERHDDTTWVLTPAGALLGTQMANAVEEERLRGRRPYRPFTGYVPTAYAAKS